eukprot:4815-Chlamydomonas_euryale.AAC.1
MGLHGATWGCMGLHGAAWGCMGLHGAAWGCMGLHGDAWGRIKLQKLVDGQGKSVEITHGHFKFLCSGGCSLGSRAPSPPPPNYVSKSKYVRTAQHCPKVSTFRACVQRQGPRGI